MGAFGKYMSKDLSEGQFIDAFLMLTAGADEVYVGVAPLDKRASRKRGGHQIVNVISVNFMGSRSEAHTIWMPWASSKNKLEVAARFFADMRKLTNMIVPAREDAKTFFRHMCRLGLMRHVGHINRYFDDGETASLFQTLEVKNA